jgi:hypothetical protein
MMQDGQPDRSNPMVVGTFDDIKSVQDAGGISPGTFARMGKGQGQGIRERPPRDDGGSQPLLVMYLIAQRYFMAGMTAGSGKSWAGSSCIRSCRSSPMGR